MIQDASYNGVNLLNGDSLSVSFNESGASKLTVTGTAFSSNGLGVAAVSTGTGGQFQTDAEISTAMSSIATALTTVRTQTSTFGANNTILQTRQDFTKSLIETLQSGADQLVAADMNEESAWMLALQTRQQIAQTSLSLAGQAQQQALRLFSF